MVEFLPSKQAVAGSSPVSRSFLTDRLFTGASGAIPEQASNERTSKETVLFLVRKRTAKTCPIFGQQPASCDAKTCFAPRDNLPSQVRKHLPSQVRKHLPPGFFPGCFPLASSLASYPYPVRSLHAHVH